MNRHQFEQAAKSFRAGRITLSEFAGKMYPGGVPVAQQQPASSSDRESLASNRESLASNRESLASNRESLAKRSAGFPVSETGRQLAASVVQRPSESHKGDYGRVLAIGGSAAMPGAISMCGLAALRTGSGLVAIATPGDAKATVAAFSPCYMVNGFSPGAKGQEDAELTRLISKQLSGRCSWADVVAIGPGLSTAQHLKFVVTGIFLELEKPFIVDADGINLLAGANLSRHAGPRILTPHPGEFARLTGNQFESREAMEEAATNLANSSKVTIVLKGTQTFVTDGTSKWHNQNGNAGMATAGSGDVLTGIIAALAGQQLSTFDACRLGVELHGLAGDIAAKKFGLPGMIATDILDCIPEALLVMAVN